MTYQLIHNDILKWAASYRGPKFHSLFCDPPYHLTITKRFGKPGSAPAKHGKDGAFSRASKGFMGQAWDGGEIAFNPETWAALGEHLYPGGFGMAFASSRGWHRLAVAIEDAGFIIHPSIFGWCFLSGFPKATRIDTAIQRDSNEPMREGSPLSSPAGNKGGTLALGGGWKTAPKEKIPTLPLAQTWEGHRYGLQAMKPALEPIILFQKPYTGRPVDCIITTGAGALNIDGGRVSLRGIEDHRTATAHQGNGASVNPYFTRENQIEREQNGENPRYDQAGRWPANLILDEAGAAVLNEQSGNRAGGSPKTGDEPSDLTKHVYGERNPVAFPGYDDDGGASRMFFQSHWSYEILEQLANADPLRYEPKVSTAEREAGLDDLPERLRHRVNAGGLENEPRFAPVKLKNHHPTLKPISLTKYLTTLLLPPDAYTPRRILVPFAGAGSEMIGAILAGWDEIIGIEKTAEYIPITEARLAWWSRWPEWGQRNVEKILASTLAKQGERQLSLFEAAQ